MSALEQEIASQPQMWRTAAAMGAEAREALPAAGARIAVVSCGTSWFMAQSVAALREAGGLGETDAFTPTEMPPGRRYDAVVVISRSGTTTEIVRALRAVPPGTPTVAISAVPHSPVVEAAGSSILLESADEQSVVQTRFATTALANEAALKLREACQAWTEAYPAMEYRHGPISVAEPHSVVWSLGEAEPELLEQVAQTGATVVAGELDPMAELVRVHRIAGLLAEAKGLDPNQPRHLTRSVVLRS